MRTQPPQARSEVGQCRTWIRLDIRGLVDSISMSEKLEPEVVVRGPGVLRCDAMVGKAARNPCLLGLVNMGCRGLRGEHD